MTHANAPLTPTGRLRLARCVVDDLWPLRRADWVAFAFWAWEHARTLGVAPAVVAREVADLTATVEDLHPEFARPTANAVVRDFLANLTGAMDLSDKDLIAAAALHRHAVRDADVAASLDQWIGRRTDIPSVSLPKW